MLSTVEKLKNTFNLYYQNLCYYAYTLTRDRLLAEDFVQEAFISLQKKPTLLSKDYNVLKSYLFTSVKNNVLNYNRRNKVVQRYFERTPFNELLEIDFDHAIIKAEILSEVNTLINELPASCQHIFKLHYLEGLSLYEIASELNLSINTIKTQRLRGLKYIKSKLNPEFFLMLLFFSK